MKYTVKYLLIIAGCALFAVSVVWFAEPAGLVTGGFSGISIIIAALGKQLLGFKIPVAASNLALNIPVFWVCAHQRGLKFVSRSLFAVVLSSLFMSAFEYIPPFFDVRSDKFLSSIMAGALSGAGLGAVLSTLTTTGGTDMLASAIKHKYPALSIPVIMLAVDVVIIFSGIFVFGFSSAVYGVISLVISSKIIDTFLGGLNFTKAVFIISDKTQSISDEIFSYARRGNTLIHATGMYTQKRRDILFVVGAAKEISIIKEIVKKNDSGAFMVVCSATEVLGEGFSAIEKPSF